MRISPYKTSAELAAACRHVLAGRIRGGRIVPPAEREPMTQVEAAERLGVTQEAVSQAVNDTTSGRNNLKFRILREIGGLEVESEPRYYVAAPG